MSSTQVSSEPSAEAPRARTVDMKLEVVVIPVSDVARAAEFYGRLGWRRDADIVTGDRRVLQFTPPGSPCSIIFATGVTPSAFGPAKFLHLVVSDIETAREERPDPAQLSVVRDVQRPGRERLAAAGGHQPAPRSDRFERDELRIRAGPGERAPPCGGRTRRTREAHRST
jgi:catechol 2,3-dioxygenase-like lactoylglutathione lyase family enzyme